MIARRIDWVKDPFHIGYRHTCSVFTTEVEVVKYSRLGNIARPSINNKTDGQSLTVDRDINTCGYLCGEGRWVARTMGSRHVTMMAILQVLAHHEFRWTFKCCTYPTAYIQWCHVIGKRPIYFREKALITWVDKKLNKYNERSTFRTLRKNGCKKRDIY